jgi:hypothetical protein
VTTIAEYISKVGVSVDMAQLNKVDRYLKLIDAKMKRHAQKSQMTTALKFSNFSVDNTRLRSVLQRAVDNASRAIVVPFANFAIDRQALTRSLSTAVRQAVAVANREMNLRPHANRPLGGNNINGRHMAGAGVAGGVASRLWGPAVALAGGGYGLSQLNQRNQQVVSAQLQSQAVVQQAGGTAQEGTNSFQYLRSEANRVGFNYLDASGDYNKLISGLTGSGVGLKESQKVFSGFAELARVNKLDKTTQNRLFRALSQVAGKGKLQAEELTQQIAEALPGGTALFAEAYQKQIGGNKTGAKAIQQLMADMKKGKVSSDILTYAGTAASERANKGGALGYASQASQGEQARFQNAVSDMSVLASKSGIEEGFARLFRTLSTGLNDNTNLVQNLAEGFNQATIEFSKLALIPQSFSRALDGKQSQVAEWLGTDKIQQYKTDLESVSLLIDSIVRSTEGKTNPFLNFGNLAKNTTNDVALAVGAAGSVSRFVTNTGLIQASENQKGYDQANSAIPGAPEFVKQGWGLARANASSIWNTAETLGSLVTYTGSAWLNGEAPDWKKYEAPIQYGNYLNSQNPENAGNMAREQAMAQASTNNSNNTFNVTISLGSVGNGEQDMQRAGQMVGEAFRSEIETAGLRFSKIQ